MEQVYSRKEQCCGCGACAELCPCDAIRLTADAEGFLYPQINEAVCVDCGLCRERCPFAAPDGYKQDTAGECYVARHRSAAVLQESTSGGAFTALSDALLRRGGVVYGADYDEAFNVLHRRAETTAERDRLRISKYVQSDLRSCYAQIASDLQAGRSVLFSGTPCQTAGVRAAIGGSKAATRLLVCDLICHSIPSPLIWTAYKKLLEDEFGARLSSVRFRSKKDGWSRANSNRGFLFTLQGSDEVHEDDRFYRLFFKAATITRPSCAACPFTDRRRAADLTIADYWGIEKYSPDWFDPRGVSLIMVNSARGRSLLEECKPNLMLERRSLEESLAEQQRLREPMTLPQTRSQFWADFQRYGLAYVIEKYA